MVIRYFGLKEEDMNNTRPFSHYEFTYLIGKPLCIRAIKPKVQNIPIRSVYSIPWLAVITQVWQEGDEVYVQLGNAKFTTKELWNAFEYAVIGEETWVYTPTGKVKSTIYSEFSKPIGD